MLFIISYHLLILLAIDLLYVRNYTWIKLNRIDQISMNKFVFHKKTLTSSFIQKTYQAVRYLKIITFSFFPTLNISLYIFRYATLYVFSLVLMLFLCCKHRIPNEYLRLFKNLNLNKINKEIYSKLFKIFFIIFI